MANNEDQTDKVIIQGRDELKKNFQNGSIPSQQDFASLIDSNINKLDDGIAKDAEYGLRITPAGTNKRLISFYDTIDQTDPDFFLGKGDPLAPGLIIGSEKQGKGIILDENGNTGIGVDKPAYKLDVNGFVSMEGRIGNLVGKVSANGKWHKIVLHKKNCQGYEIMARAGLKGKGKFALMHAIALNTYGKGKIKKTNAFYGFCWNRINLKWTGTSQEYNLEIKTNSNLGNDCFIYYKICKLWEDETFLPLNELYEKEEKLSYL